MDKKTVTVEIKLTPKEIKQLKCLTFKADEDDKDKLSSEIWLKETVREKNFADKMTGIGIFTESVTSWGYQETGFYLTVIGKQILNKLQNG